MNTDLNVHQWLKIFTMYKLLFFLFFGLQLQAQNPFSIEPNPAYGTGLSSDNFFNADAVITNDTDSILTLSWERNIQSLTSGWETAACLNITCLATDVSSGEIMIEPGFPINLNCTFYPNDLAGEGEVHFNVWVKNDTSTLITQVYFGNAELDPTSTKELEEKLDLKIFPNPTLSTFLFEENQRVEFLEIFSLEGKKVAEFANQTVFDVSFLPTDMYFVYVYNEQRELSTVLKLTKL